MRTIVVIILSLILLWAPSYGQDEEARSVGISFSIKADFYKPGSTPVLSASEAGLFLKDGALQLASPMATFASLKSSLEMDSTATYFTFSQTMDGKTFGIPTIIAIDDFIEMQLEYKIGRASCRERV